MPTAYARYGNQVESIAFDYTCGWGVQPGTITLTAPITFLAQNLVDTLTVYYNETTFLQLTDVRFISANAPSPTSGDPTRTLTLQDRRWMWQFGLAVNGSYNQEIEPEILTREKTPRELATILFTALGETNVDVTALPTDPRPPISWLAARPAQELEKLLTDYGCTLVFDPFQNKPLVKQVGTGSGPPNLPADSKSNSVVYPAQPDSVFLIGGPVVFQTALELGEDVGMDTDGQYKPLKDLSYAPDSSKPLGGFEEKPVNDFSWLPSTYTDPITGATLYHRDLAQATVWRTKRIIGQAGGGFSPQALIGTPFEPTLITDLGPFASGLIEQDSRTKKPLDPLIIGTHAVDNQGEEKNLRRRYRGGLSIDDKKMLVSTSDPLYLLDPTGNFSAVACDDLVLIAAYSVTVRGVPVVYSYRTPIVGNTYGAGELIDYHQDLVAKIAEQGATWLGTAIDNRPSLDLEMQAYTNAIIGQLQFYNAATRDFPGLIQLSFDGQLREVNWSFSTTSPPMTSAAWNCERNPYAKTWEARNSGRFVRLSEEFRFRAFAPVREADVLLSGGQRGMIAYRGG